MNSRNQRRAQIFVGAAEGCESVSAFAAFGSSYNTVRAAPTIPALDLAVDLAVDLAFDFKRPVKPRWPEFDIDSAGKPAWMPV